MHRLVQAVLKVGMDEAQAQQWIERILHAFDASLPQGGHREWGGIECWQADPADLSPKNRHGIPTWGQYERLVPHALVCTFGSRRKPCSPMHSRLLTHVRQAASASSF